MDDKVKKVLEQGIDHAVSGTSDLPEGPLRDALDTMAGTKELMAWVLQAAKLLEGGKNEGGKAPVEITLPDDTRDAL